VTIIGETMPRGAVLRSGARPGDWLLVTGHLGGSILGKHLTFTPRVHEALRLHELADLHAMIDISDGLAADLGHICTESGCGAVLRAADIPISDEARRMADGRPPLDHALADGEDFELLFAVSPEDGRRLLAEQPVAGIRLVLIGECVEKGLWLEQEGKRAPLEPRGWVHELQQ
jgi:thiamine-monophosphate kinase